VVAGGTEDSAIGIDQLPGHAEMIQMIVTGATAI